MSCGIILNFYRWLWRSSLELSFWLWPIHWSFLWRFIQRCKIIDRNSWKWSITVILFLIFLSGREISWCTFSIMIDFFNTFLVILFQLLILFNEIRYLFLKSGNLILIKHLFSQFILRLESLFIEIFFISKRKNNFKYLLKVFSLTFV